MRWKIVGADANSGAAVAVEIEADTEMAARLEAKKRRVLVSEVSLMAEAAAADRQGLTAPARSRSPRDVLNLADNAEIIGALLIGVGVLGLVGGFAVAVQGGEVTGAIYVVGGLILIALGCILRLLAGMARCL